MLIIIIWVWEQELGPLSDRKNSTAVYWEVRLPNGAPACPLVCMN